MEQSSRLDGLTRLALASRDMLGPSIGSQLRVFDDDNSEKSEYSASGLAGLLGVGASIE
jgi:hypothetical protein